MDIITAKFNKKFGLFPIFLWMISRLLSIYNFVFFNFVQEDPVFNGVSLFFFSILDSFGSLVPVAIQQSVTAHNTRTADFVNREVASLREQTQLMNA